MALEVQRGLVSATGALRYGVVLTAVGTVDTTATEAKRAALRDGRGPLPVFDRGDAIETLRANCLAETGLPAPRAPTSTRPSAAVA